MIEGRKNIISWFEATGKPYWIIYIHGKIDTGNPSYRSTEAEGATNSDALNDLKRILQIISRGKYIIVSCDKPQITARGTMREDFEIPYSEDHPGSSVSGPPANSMSAEDVRSQIKLAVSSALKEYKREQEIEAVKQENLELKKENRELSRSVNDPWNKIAGVVAPVVEKYYKETPAVVAGIPANEKIDDNVVSDDVVEDLTEDEQERLGTILYIFKKHDPDYINTLDRMAKKLESNPAILTMIKSFI